ncbi:transposable element Tcb2 transposase [Trichonephila clavipes]|nr:transposable element Tcb2 transposase [Trichonephila clavipes]
MSWPSNSPDLNHIEHVWDILLGRQIAALSTPKSSVTGLMRAVHEAWNRLSLQLIHHLIAIMNGLQQSEVVVDFSSTRPFPMEIPCAFLTA